MIPYVLTVWLIFAYKLFWDTSLFQQISDVKTSVKLNVNGIKFHLVKLKIYCLLRASEGTLSRWSRLHLQSLAPTNPHWVRVVGYGPFSLCVIHKEGLCPCSGDINRLMMKSPFVYSLYMISVYSSQIVTTSFSHHIFLDNY
jgi:hypothetical protein